MRWPFVYALSIIKMLAGVTVHATHTIRTYNVYVVLSTHLYEITYYLAWYKLFNGVFDINTIDTWYEHRSNLKRDANVMPSAVSETTCRPAPQSQTAGVLYQAYEETGASPLRTTLLWWRLLSRRHGDMLSGSANQHCNIYKIALYFPIPCERAIAILSVPISILY